MCIRDSCEAHTLHIDTQTETGEKVSVRFTGLLAHWFENVIQDNILFGMDEITVDGFFQQYKDLLGGTISYGSVSYTHRVLVITAIQVIAHQPPPLRPFQSQGKHGKGARHGAGLIREGKPVSSDVFVPSVIIMNLFAITMF